MAENEKKFEHVSDVDKIVIDHYREFFNNTGGNDPVELLDDLQSEHGANMMQTNVVRYLLAFAVHSQTILIKRLMREGRLPKIEGVEL